MFKTPQKPLILAAIMLLAPVVLMSQPMHADGTKPLRTAINPSHLTDTRQYGYSQANITAPGAQTVFVAGQVGMSPDGPNDFQSQVDRSFDNMNAVLEAAGATPADVVKITLLIADHDPQKLAYLVKKRRAVFGDAPPASTLIPVTRLYADGVMFEIDATAVVQ